MDPQESPSHPVKAEDDEDMPEMSESIEPPNIFLLEDELRNDLVPIIWLLSDPVLHNRYWLDLQGAQSRTKKSSMTSFAFSRFLWCSSRNFQTFSARRFLHSPHMILPARQSS